MVASKKVEALSGKNPPALGQPLPLTVPLSLAGGNIKANSISQSNINEWMNKHLAWLIYQSVECRALMFFGVGKFGPKGGQAGGVLGGVLGRARWGIGGVLGRATSIGGVLGRAISIGGVLGRARGRKSSPETLPPLG